jgi:protein-S-isoprenylcysteine O-methyltransferase Ste14
VAAVPSQERGADVRFPPPLVFLIGLLTGVLLRYVWMPLRFPAARLIGIVAGLALIGSAIAIAASARRRMVKTGRNPMYLGLTLLTIGLGFALDNLWISLLAIPSLAAVHFIAVLPEERYLSDKFGPPYRDYLTRVRRYI